MSKIKTFCSIRMALLATCTATAIFYAIPPEYWHDHQPVLHFSRQLHAIAFGIIEAFQLPTSPEPVLQQNQAFLSREEEASGQYGFPPGS